MLKLGKALVLQSLKLLLIVEIVKILWVTLLYHLLSDNLCSSVACAIYTTVVQLVYDISLLALRLLRRFESGYVLYQV